MRQPSIITTKQKKCVPPPSKLICVEIESYNDEKQKREKGKTAEI